MKKKTLAAAVCISAVLLLAACGKDTNTSVPASQNVMSSSSSEILPQYSAEQSTPTSSQTESKPEQTEIDWSAVPIIAETELEYVDNSDGTVTVTKYLGSETVLNYPSEIDGKKVIDIDPPENCTAVKLPDSVTNICKNAFITCSEKLTINYKGKSYSGKSIEELYDKDLSKM